MVCKTLIVRLGIVALVTLRASWLIAGDAPDPIGRPEEFKQGKKPDA